MNDDTKASERAVDADDIAAGVEDDGSKQVNGVSAPIASPLPSDKSNKNATGGEANGDTASAKGDSEAETILLGEDSPEKKTRPIKTEDDLDRHGSPIPEPKDSKVPSDEVKSRKRKRPEDEGGENTNAEMAPSSPRSSVLSSPATNLRYDKTDDSESTSTRRLSPHIVPASKANPEPTLRKRRLSEYHADDDDEKHRKAHRQQLNRDEPSNKDRRETRSATFTRHTSNERSQSPGSRSHKRVHSTQSVQTAATKKKRIPPPLVTNPKRGRSEDRSSISSSASGSPLPPSHLRKLTTDNVSMSPAKMAPHRKLRDQNGRTLIARACAVADLTQVQIRCEERPEDINVADNAGNTPLQIAALEGSAEIVAFLVSSGCEIDTKNIDKDTPLIDAIENGHLDVVKILLDGGANPRLPNAQGDEPYDLVDPTSKNASQMRKLIAAAKEKDSKRRRSDDQSGHNSATFKDTSSRAASAVSPRDSPPINFPGPRSPPVSTTSRRRTVRSEGSRNDLLWLKPTQDSLTEYAGRGDMEAVGQIVNVTQKAGPESLIAAAKGGHHDVIGLLFALGDANPDPDPIRGGSHKPGHNTPMLAAIGKGHEKVIELLLSQSGFNPTRRIYRDQTYYEISKDRKGENWEKEYKLLKDAYDKYSGKDRKNRKSDPISPRRAREKEKENRRSTHATSSSPVARSHKSVKDVIKSHRRDSDVPARRVSDVSKQIKRDVSGVTKDNVKDRSGVSLIKRQRVRDSSSVERSAIVSDQEQETSSVGPPKEKEHKTRRSQSDLPTVKPDVDASKQRRRLMTKKAFRSEEEQKRKASGRASPSNDEAGASKIARLEISKDKAASLKRPRTSISRSRSPSRTRSERPHSVSRHTSDEIMKKRRRLQPEDVSTEKPKQDKDVVMTDANENGPASKPPKATSTTLPSQTSRPASPAPTEAKHEAFDPIELPTAEEKARKEKEKAEAEKEAKEKQLRAEAEEKAKAEAEAKAEQERVAAEIERQKEEQKKREEAERLARIAKEEEEARLEKERKAEEEARLARIAREEEERLEKRRQAEKKAEEDRLRRIEQERLRREEAERRRVEQERRERAAFLERQAAEERRRRETLPNSLCKAAELAELNPQAALDPDWIKRFFPLFTVTTKELDPLANPNLMEQWIINFQVAPLLGIKDLQLSQCKPFLI
jgi:ankyrin repeat protein